MQIQTERLSIRPLHPDDYLSMQKIAGDFRQSPYVIYDMPLPTEDGAIRALTKQFADTQLFFAVCEKASAEMIGYICFHQEGDVYDLGYCFHSAWHGRGYAYESCVAAMQAIQQRAAVTAFTAGTALANAPSRRLLEKLGFTLQSTESLSFRKDADGNDIVFEGGNFVKTLP